MSSDPERQELAGTKKTTTKRFALTVREPDELVEEGRGFRVGGSYTIDLATGFLALIFACVGLVLTYNGKYRGVETKFIYGFFVVFGLSIAEFALIVVICASCFRITNAGRCCCTIACATRVSTIASIISSIAGIPLLVIAIMSADGVEYSHEAGCHKGYGCGNILAIITIIFYSVRILVITILFIICYCCCPCCCTRGQEQ